MATALHTFMDVFDSVVDADGKEIVINKIIIPMIQRDYAQGRQGDDITRIRMRFLESLYNAITDKSITLDFVYGDIKDGVMTPLDGQQRLTTLFLLHWYAAKKYNILPEEYGFLNRFSYETRYSARHFCISLVNHMPSFTCKISEEIINQAWFPLEWKKDPTISSMLVMLDDIDHMFKDASNLWERLKEGAITFYFLPIRDMGLTDELYIKMNSRGKPLTTFEHFKAELERELKKTDEEIAKRIIHKIDISWTEMLWPYKGDNNIIDDEFLKYFKFICDVICYHQGGTPQGKSDDEFDLLKEYFSHANPAVLDNVKTLEMYFDCWCRLDGVYPGEFLTRLFSRQHEPGKVIVDTRYDIDLFRDCLNNYADSTGRRRIFPLNRIILLYAITCYLIHKDSITEEQLARRLRVINNLVQNSSDEISDSEARASGNRMPAIFAQVDRIMMTGEIDSQISSNFSMVQLAEETEKEIWVREHPEMADRLYTLEDHALLQGQIGIIGLENPECFDKFPELFSCNWDKVDCALMATGFYPQREQNGWRYQFGTSSNRNIIAWHDLFHKSRNAGFEKTKEILITLLSQYEHFTNETLDQIVTGYILDCEQKQEYPIQYYYIKYPEFRPGCYGKYYINTRESSGNYYNISIMVTRTNISEYTYVPYFKIADEPHLSKDDYGQKLIYQNAYIVCHNSSYEIKKNDTGELLEEIKIIQNEEGIDKEDRIIKLEKYLAEKPDCLFK